MRKFTLSLLTLSLGVTSIPASFAAPSAQEQLLNQVRLGESSKREDIVQQSLYRLELIDPNNPQVLAARLRYMLRQGDTAGAQKQLERIKSLAPDSTAYRAARTELLLNSAEGRQALQQARLLATTGHPQEALAAYEKAFSGPPPDGDYAVEYWSTALKIPAQRNDALTRLQALNKQMPGNVTLQSTLARNLLADNRRDEAFAVLEQMAKSSNGRNEAGDVWFTAIKDLPPSQGSVQALQRYLQIFTTGEQADNARALLAEQQKTLSDPAVRAKSDAAAALASGNTAAAISDLQRAVSSNDKDADAVGTLGEAYSSKGDRARAVAQLQKAIALDPQNASRGKWDSLLKTNRYWLLIQQGDAALKANNPGQAQTYYQQAQRVDNSDSYAILGLGDVAAARKDYPTAEGYYQQTLRMDRDNNLAVRGLANVYRAQSPERATAYIQTLSAAQRRSIDDIERSLTNDRLEQQAQALEDKGEWAQAATVQRQRLAFNPDSVWITYRLAKDLDGAGPRREADTLMRSLAQKQANNPDQVYAYGLYLSSSGRDSAAIAHLSTLPRSQWSSNIQALSERLETAKIMQQANSLRDGGQEKRAIALLKKQPPSARISLTLADWAQQRGDSAQAIALYHGVLSEAPQDEDARLGLAELYLAQGDKAAARAQLAQLPSSGEALSMGMQRRVALVQSGLGENGRARQTFNVLAQQAKTQPPSMDSALVLRDAARFQAQDGDRQQALETYKDTMVATGITPTRPQDNDTFTRLTRSDASDDWLKRGVRSDAADLYRQQDLNVTLEHDYWGSSGTGGSSALKAHTTMLQVDAPLSDGRMFFRSDWVDMNVGSFSRNGDGSYSPDWGTCGIKDRKCYGGASSNDSGVSVAVGWKNDTWSGDIGTTPMGFNVVEVVGGLSYSNSLGPIGYTLEGHRRPISSSLLAFGGQQDNSKDGHTGKKWGGVRADGGVLSMSYDKGDANGVWASLGADRLTGKNVDDNWRVRWMTGYYYKVVNENNRRVTVGLNNMIWHYQKDLSGYTLGQGGYYSPQEYVSFAVPVTWRQRTENWSWELGGSVSWSHSRTQSQASYPLMNLIPDDWRKDAADDRSSGGSSQGFGYTARALVERRVSSNWFVGTAIDIQQAKDYTPSHALLYVRYSAAGWQGDLDMPPQPLVPYADW